MNLEQDVGNMVNFPKRERSHREKKYPYGKPGCAEHIFYRLARYLRGLQGESHYNEELSAIAHVQALIRSSYLRAIRDEPTMITAANRGQYQGRVTETILQFILNGPNVEAIRIEEARRFHSGLFVLNDNNAAHMKLRYLAEHSAQVLEQLELIGRKTMLLSDLRVIIDGLCPNYNQNDWTNFALRGHKIGPITTRIGCRRAIVLHKSMGQAFFSVAVVR